VTWREPRAAVAVLAALAAVAAGCQGTKNATPGSCWRDRDSACTEYAADRAIAGKRMCGSFTWREGASTCPAENRLGTCTAQGGGVVEILYGGPPNHYTPEAARGECMSSRGQWAPFSNASSR
jgi:hypothetical protein